MCCDLNNAFPTAQFVALKLIDLCFPTPRDVHPTEHHKYRQKHSLPLVPRDRSLDAAGVSQPHSCSINLGGAD